MGACVDKILIIGAGPVGQVYGHYLQRGGAEVSFFVKEKYRKECEQGFSLYRCRRQGLSDAETFKAESILTEFDQIAAAQWDQVWLAMSSTDLRGDLLGNLTPVMGNATLVMLQPGVDDQDYVLQHIESERLVYGVVNFLGFRAPLPDLPPYHQDANKKGVAYLLLPLLSAGFSGSPERLADVMAALADGRLSVKAKPNAARIYADRSAIMIPFVAVLEMNGWSLSGLFRSESLSTCVAASREALAVVAAKNHRRLNWIEKHFSVFLLRCAIGFVRKMGPMELESFLKYQFEKTAAQTRFMLQIFICQGEQEGVDVASIKLLLAQLPIKEESHSLAYDAVSSKTVTNLS